MQHHKQIPIVGIGAGAFILAEAGLLNHNKVAVHWKFKKNFQEKFPYLNLVNDAVQNLDINPEQAVYTLSVPNVGYDLVLPMEEARRLPDAEEVEVTKQDRGGDVTVTGIVTSKPMQDFLQDKMSVVIRQTTLDYVPEDLKENPEIVSGVEEGRVYSILSAWPIVCGLIFLNFDFTS